ncbi:hypothetical protein CES85_2063 [Ochrobactrum quorumnocens]|uniref:Uncharacterized protein n=1 Tax=Ochrobactrum quorumnocens TaxID=271865 RepID=A0A248UKT1_9HYPH|nr:hypothetical protein CES85_2063 [[Ochrobactrum] quorumnocens]
MIDLNFGSAKIIHPVCHHGGPGIFLRFFRDHFESVHLIVAATFAFHRLL